MRTEVAGASLLVLGVVAIVSFGDDSRSMFAPVSVPTMTSGQMSATSIYGSSFGPLENMQYVQPSYAQPVEYVAAEDSWAWAYAGAGALLVGAVAAASNRSGQTRVAEPDLEAATGAARVATLAVSGRQVTRRDMAVGMGAALAAMVQSPAFADDAKKEAKKAVDDQKLPSDASKGLKPIYNPLGERSTDPQYSTIRKPSDPNGCSAECRQKRLEKYGY